MTGAEAVGVGLGFLAIVAPEFWPKMPRALSFTLAGVGLSWLTYSGILGIESLSHSRLQYGPLILIILGAMLIGGGLLWHFNRHTSANDHAAQTEVASHPAPQVIAIPQAPPVAHAPHKKTYLRSDAEILVPALRKISGILYESTRDGTSLQGPFKNWYMSRRAMNQRPGFQRSGKEEAESLIAALDKVLLFYRSLQEAMGEIYNKNTSFRETLAPFTECVYPPQEMMNDISDMRSLLSSIGGDGPLDGNLVMVIKRYGDKVSEGIEKQYQARSYNGAAAQAKINEINESLE